MTSNEVIRLCVESNAAETDAPNILQCNIKVEITEPEGEINARQNQEFAHSIGELVDILEGDSPTKEDTNIKLLDIADTEIEESKIDEEDCDELPHEVSIANLDLESDLNVEGASNEDKPNKPKKSPKIHSCNVCYYITTQKSHYRRHLQTHVKTFNLNCPICKIQLNSKHELSKHLPIHRCIDDPSRYQCMQCEYNSNKLTNVSQHVLVHNKPKVEKFPCGLCKFKASCEENLKSHEASHRRANDMKCGICTLVFPSKFLLKKHLNEHKSPDDPLKYVCPECPYTANKFYNVKIHMIKHRNEFEINMFPCPECPFKAKRKTDLKQHITVKHRSVDEVEMYKCSECVYVTKRKTHLKTHMANMHGKEERKCPHCSFKANRYSQLVKHVREHKTAELIKQFLCSVCGYVFNRKGDLTKHYSSHYEDLNGQIPEEGEQDEESAVKVEAPTTIYECSICYETTDDEQKLLEHVHLHNPEISDQVHSKCEFCDFRGETTEDLECHKLTHEGIDNEYRCSQCTFHCKSRYLFVQHLKVHGLNVDSYKNHLCEICGTKWLRKGDLTRHMTKHWEAQNSSKGKTKAYMKKSDRKLLACGFCDYTTFLRLRLYRHMAVHGADKQNDFFNNILVEVESESEEGDENVTKGKENNSSCENVNIEDKLVHNIES